MTIALVYPPTCDPTAPYIAVPMLTAFLRQAGIDVLPVDANVEAWDQLLSSGRLSRIRDRVEARLSVLEEQRSLDHGGQLEYAALHHAYAEAHAVPHGIDEAKAVLRDREAFYDPDRYGDAVATIDAATRAISAAYYPLHIDFMTYRTPFGLLTPDNVRAEADRDHNPFFDYVESTLAPRLASAVPSVIGISVCFPGQLQPAYGFAYQLRALFPNVHLTCGGPGLTQILARLRGRALQRALGPFDSAILYEGERALLALVEALKKGASLDGLPNLRVRRRGGAPDANEPSTGVSDIHRAEDLSALPPPDFDGMPLDRYFAPHLVLPYDPTRGCYWGKCAFCHYGLADVGTAKYRERPVEAVVDHLRTLRDRHGTRHFYFSQDSVAPKTAVAISTALVQAGLDIRWGTDLKPEKHLTPPRAQELAKAGAIACALGVESGDDRVLSLIGKGAPVSVVSDVIDHLARAGVAVEAMCFTDFPTETRREALRTLAFLRKKADRLGLFIVGEFGLTHGSRVAQNPAAFGLSELWVLRDDELGLGVFYEEAAPAKTDDDRDAVDAALDEVSQLWRLRPYPWAGAISTTHTLLYYDRFGPGIFRELIARRASRVLGTRPLSRMARFDVLRACTAQRRDAEIWSYLVREARSVSRSLYRKLAARTPTLSASPKRFRFVPGDPPRRA